MCPNLQGEGCSKSKTERDRSKVRSACRWGNTSKSSNLCNSELECMKKKSKSIIKVSAQQDRPCGMP